MLLDEPFRGLDRPRRRELLAGARDLWPAATMLCVTHDVGETLGFARVLVVEDGRLVEDGDPRELARTEGSRYRTLLERERAVLALLHRDPVWTRLEVRDAGLRRGPGEEVS